MNRNTRVRAGTPEEKKWLESLLKESIEWSASQSICSRAHFVIAHMMTHTDLAPDEFMPLLKEAME